MTAPPKEPPTFTADEVKDMLGPISPELDIAWDRKETGVARHDEYDISPQLCWLGAEGELLAGFIAPAVQRNMALLMADLLTVTTDAETLAMTVDAHITQQMTNPATGEHWGPGEMQEACNNDGACDLGLITDCIWTTVYDKSGRIRGVSRLYHVNHDAKQVHWQPGVQFMDTADSPDQKVSGFVIDSLAHAFSRADSSAMIPPPPEVTPEQARLHRIVGAARIGMAICGGGALMINHGGVEGGDEIVATLTEQSVHELFDHPLFGRIIPVLRAKYEIAA